MKTLRLVAVLFGISAGICGAQERGIGSKYLFEWVGAFHAAIEVRIELRESEPGRIVASIKSEPPVVKTRALSADESALFIRELNAAGFWRLPEKFEQPCPSGAVCTGCRDGAIWTISVEERSRIHAISRHCSGVKSVEPIGYLFVRLSGLQLDHELY